MKQLFGQNTEPHDSAHAGNEPLWQTILGCLALLGLWAMTLIILYERKLRLGSPDIVHATSFD